MAWIVADLYAAQTVCVGFHSFQGEGATIMRSCYENDSRNTRKTRKKIKKNLRNLCNLWASSFSYSPKLWYNENIYQMEVRLWKCQKLTDARKN